MSTFVELAVECTRCGTTIERSVATSINASRSPEWRDVILEGSFQRYSCPTCGEVLRPVIPFPYIDFGRHQYIGVFPLDQEEAWWTVEHEPEDAFRRNLGVDAPPIARPIGDHMVVRTVFGLAALREKIITLDAGLDDAALETLKLRLMYVVDDLAPDLASRPRLVEVTDELLRFDIDAGEASTAPQWLEVDRSQYESVASDGDLNSFVEALTRGPYRDAGRLLRPAPVHA